MMSSGGITLDAGALHACEIALRNSTEPIREHMGVWRRKKILISTPALAWAEYWRGRSANVHYIAKVRELVSIIPVSRIVAETAAEALRSFPPSTNRNSVKHLIDAIVMAHADQYGDAVYTADIDDFEPLWDQFNQVKSLVSSATGKVVCHR